MAALASTPRPPRSRGNPAFQIATLLFTNTLILVGTILVLTTLYKPPHAIPLGFVIGEAVIIIVASLTISAVFMVHGIDEITRPDDEDDVGEAADSGRLAAEDWWLQSRSKLFKVEVVILFLAMLFALERLAAESGGGIASPFAPLLTAPGIFAPFLARTWYGGAVGIVITLLVVAYSVVQAPDAPPADELGDPSRAVYVLVAGVLVSLAGIITVMQQWRRQRERNRRRRSREPRTDGAIA